MSNETLAPHLMSLDELKEMVSKQPAAGDASESEQEIDKDKQEGQEQEAPKQPEPPADGSSKPDTTEGFEFDRKVYEERGVTDETALQLLEEQARKLWEKDRFIGKQSNEVGDSRKREQIYQAQIEELETQKQALQRQIITTDEYNELAITSPYEAAQKFTESRDAQKAIRDIETRQGIYKRELVNRSLIPDVDKYSSEIVDILRDEVGLPEQQLASVKDNLASSFDVPVLDSLVARAKLKSKARDLEAEIQRLQAENQKLQSKPKEVIDRMKAVRKLNPTMASTSVSTPGTSTSWINKPSHLMTMEELREIRKMTQ